MSDENKITSVINLNNVDFIRWYIDKVDTLRILVRPKSAKNICPQCGKSNSKKSEVLYRQVRDLDVCGRVCYVQFKHIRLECISCRKRWMQPLDFVSDNYRYTQRFEKAVYELCRATNAKHAGSHFGLSDKTARDIYYRVADKRRVSQSRSPMKKLGIDEIAMHKGHNSFIVILSDITNKKAIDVLEERTKICLESYLKSLPENIKNSIESVSIDLWGPYYSAVKNALPNAIIVADRFHVQQNLNKALNKCRCDVKKILHPGDKDFWAHGRYGLLKNAESLTEEQREAVYRITRESEVLKKCYLFKEKFRMIFNNSKKIDDARILIYKWIAEVFTTEETRHYYKFIKTMLNWEDEVLNYFIDFTTSGFVEGLNNKIQLIKRISYGFNNFNFFKKKILDCCR